ncbi:MAG: thiamine phosphate synthase [Candidatus Pelagibacter sp.]
MHRLPKKYYFIKNFNTTELKNLNSNTAIIFRNYEKNPEIGELLDLKRFCKNRNIKVYLSNHFKLALKLGFDGAYIPSFNKSFRFLNYSLKKNFKILGSAHNLKEIRFKENQKVNLVFISSIFKKNKNYLGLYKFINLKKLTNRRVIALGGVNIKNIKLISLANCFGFAGISYFE